MTKIGTMALFLLVGQLTYAQTVQTVHVFPGDPKSEITLAPGLRIVFGRASWPAVPDLILGDHYVLNDRSARNDIPISGKVSAYADGQLFTVEKVACKIEKKFFGDSFDEVVTSCTLRITTQPSQKPKVGTAHFRKVVSVGESSPAEEALSQDPLVYFSSSPFFIQKYDLSGVIIGGEIEVSGGENDPIPVLVVTNYGPLEADFLPAELYDGVSKTLKRGGLTVTITPVAEVATRPSQRFDTHRFAIQVDTDDALLRDIGSDTLIMDFRD